MKQRITMEKIMGITALVLSLVLVIGTAFIFHACGPKDDGTYMNCHNAQNAAVIAGAVLFVMHAIAMVIPRKIVKAALRALATAGSVFTALIPQTIIHLCMMNNMRCQAVMKPAVILVSILLAVVSAVSLVMTIKQKAQS